MKAMLLSKLKNVALVLAVGVLGSGGWLAYRSFAVETIGATQRAARDKAAATAPDTKEAESKKPNANASVDNSKKVVKQETTSRKLMDNLRIVMDMTGQFQNPMTLKEALGLFYEHFNTKGMELPILIDTNPFKEENPDSPDIYDTLVKFPPFPKKMTAAAALKLAINQLPAAKPAMVVRYTALWITTQKYASLPHLLQERLFTSFQSRPLSEVVQELSDLTGASIAIDPRVEEKAKTLISVSFGNDVNLEGALRIVADMAGLKVVDMQSGLYITTPANAQELEKELRGFKKNVGN